MAKAFSTMMALGTQAPAFLLLDAVSGEWISLPKPGFKKATVIMFICNHCPYVQHINHQLSRLSHDYQSQSIAFIGINANDISQYPLDSPLNMKQIAHEQGYCFPYLFDETQAVAKAYQAACTPDFFVFNHLLNLVYRGQLDDARPGNQAVVTGSSIRLTLDCLLKNQPVSTTQIPSVGCSIKWKK